MYAPSDLISEEVAEMQCKATQQEIFNYKVRRLNDDTVQEKPFLAVLIQGFIHP